MKNKNNINDMHYGSDSFTFQKANQLRENMTEAENILWEKLRNNKFLGLKFRRQHPISRFIVDFYCHKYKLVIELDGKIHLKTEVGLNDKKREEELKEYGLNILKFRNEDILENLNVTLITIKDFIEEINFKNQK
ncbi:MAG TPA: endonuclease domain-containing protein [Bacteroidales bacterium]|nr:endonuclease domain-containing protein [Bacteroidales bacterium]